MRVFVRVTFLSGIPIRLLGRSMGEKGICPRCGRPISWFETRRVGNREYVYAAHYQKGKRGRRDLCYLGPTDGYVLVTATHRREGLILKGLNDPDRVLEYFGILLKRVLSDERLKGEVRRRFGMLLKDLSQ